MIVTNATSDPFATSTVVSDYGLTARDRYEGTLVCAHGSYPVACRFEDGNNTRACPQVTIRTELDDRKAGMRALQEISRRALADDAWAPVAVDPRDGETLYSCTLTVDISPEALDRFYASARDFLDAHGEELEAILSGRASSDRFSISEFLGLAE